MRNTQAYGAALLHGFALDRLEAANVENAREFVREAEKEEELDQLAAELLSQEDVDGLNSTNGTNNFSTIANNSFEDSNLLSSTLVPNNSTNTTNNSSLNNTTINSEQYKSMMPNDNTVYHSINAGDSQTRMSTSSNFDRIQRLPIMIDYGRKLRNIAEEFEKHRLRQEVKSQAEGVSEEIELQNMRYINMIYLTTLIV